MSESITPVAEGPEEFLEDGIAVAFSGGGYRAMLFHLGAVIRLFETGVLRQAARISSVSGGSITSAKLALEWPRLTDRAALFELVVKPIRKLAATSVDVPSVLGGLILPGGASERVSHIYAKVLFGNATLQDLPDAPAFVFNATNVETGKLWRFSRVRARDWSVGEIARPRFLLADVVTASSAFPPVLSPFVLETRPSDFTHVEEGVEPALLHDISLTDGGVYDSLGLETVFKRYRTLFVSDGGGSLAVDASPPADWVRHSRRVLDIIHDQVSSVRVRQLIATYVAGQRAGAYWGIGSDISNFALADALSAPVARTLGRRLISTEPQPH
ncbi:patatin-like phospholipase family protein [Novosphingobium sp. BL-8A]|uniref:patatin-like phospholipase family protein n=1 Tax=Novosphingobium sp. BL-8A TaxID=3127639 RepID=UPI0037582A96